MPLLGTYNSASIRGWKSEGSGGLTVSNRIIIATTNDRENQPAYYTDNGMNWTATPFYDSEAYGMVWNGYTLLAFGGDGITGGASISTSDNSGSNWNQETLFSTGEAGIEQPFTGGVWINDSFILVTQHGRTFTTIDGYTIYELGRVYSPPSLYNPLGEIRTNGARLVVLNDSINSSAGVFGDEFYYSDDYGVSWTNGFFPANILFSEFFYDNGLFIAITTGVPTIIYYSADGASWNSVTFTEDNDPIATMCWDGTQYVAATAKLGRIYTSPDLLTWTRRTTNVFTYATDIIYNNGAYYLLKSTDTDSFVQRFTSLSLQPTTTNFTGLNNAGRFMVITSNIPSQS